MASSQAYSRSETYAAANSSKHTLLELGYSSDGSIRLDRPAANSCKCGKRAVEGASSGGRALQPPPRRIIRELGVSRKLAMQTTLTLDPLGPGHCVVWLFSITGQRTQLDPEQFGHALRDRAGQLGLVESVLGDRARLRVRLTLERR
jgi:hypothetical protein